MPMPVKTETDSTFRRSGLALIIGLMVGLTAMPAQAARGKAHGIVELIAGQDRIPLVVQMLPRTGQFPITGLAIGRTHGPAWDTRSRISGDAFKLANEHRGEPAFGDRARLIPKGPPPPRQPQRPQAIDLSMEGFRDGLHCGRVDGIPDARHGEYGRSFNDTPGICRLSRGGGAMRVPGTGRGNPQYQRAFARGYAVGYEQGFASGSREEASEERE